jgi:hypothetical protein
VWASIRPGINVTSPRSIVVASEPASPACNETIFEPRTTTTPGESIFVPSKTRAARTSVTGSGATDDDIASIAAAAFARRGTKSATTLASAPRTNARRPKADSAVRKSRSE